MGVIDVTSLSRKFLIAVLAAALALGVSCKEKPQPGAAEVTLPENPPPQDVAAVAAIFPGRPLVFIYAPDLSAFVATSRGSGPARRYLDSQGVKRFRESRLLQKLEVRFNELAGQVQDGLAPGDLTPLAGDRSGLALYDIGELKFIYASKVALGALTQTALWAARERGEELQVKGTPCYRLEPGGGGSALYFGAANDFLIVSNMDGGFQDAFARALTDGPLPGSLLDDPGFKTAFPARLRVHSLLLFLDQAALADNPYFLHYWIYRNFDDVSWIESALIDLEIKGGAWREERFYVSRNIPGSAGNRDLSPCLRLVSEGLFGECSAVADEREAGAFLGSLVPGDQDEVAKLLAPAGPQAAGSAARIKWSDDRFFFGLARTAVIELKSPRGLDLDGLRGLTARELGARAFGEGGGRLEWRKDEYGTSCALPLFKGEALWMDQAGAFLVVSSDGALHKQVLDLARAAKGRDQGQAVKFSGVYRSTWDTAMAGDDFRKAADLLGRYDSWPHAQSDVAVQQDLQGIVDAIGPGTLTREAVREGNMVRETIRME